VPADHGLWHDWTSLGMVPAAPPVPIGGAGGDCCGVIEATAPPPFFFPALPALPLTFARDFDPALPASALVAPLPPDASVALFPKPQLEVTDDRGGTWSAERDLLSLDPLQQGFVVETERDGTSFLRFGDDEYGAAPEEGDAFSARFRTGNGSLGNVGPDTLGHVLTAESRVRTVRNPLAGAGGRDPDTMEAIRQRAPWAFRTQLRAVTESDYGDVAARDPAIREARGTLRWTGSWRTAFVAVNPTPGTENEDDLARATLDRLNMARMAGVDLAVEPAVIVGLRVALAVCIKPRYRRTDVARALSQVLIAGDVCDGTPGLLAPSRFSFGQTIYLSPIIAAAQAVEGVASVHATAFQRVADPARDAIADGFITMQRLEIARVDNDPSRPDHGILELALDGGE
jgi:predicted phage baseplate assembly protein